MAESSLSISQRIGQSPVGTYYNTMKHTKYTGSPIRAMEACANLVKDLAVGPKSIFVDMKRIYNDESMPKWKKAGKIAIVAIVGIVAEVVAAAFTALFATLTAAELIVPIPLAEKGIQYARQMSAYKKATFTPHSGPVEEPEEPARSETLSAPEMMPVRSLSPREPRFWVPINYSRRTSLSSKSA